jgi:hypothetical protein
MPSIGVAVSPTDGDPGEKPVLRRPERDRCHDQGAPWPEKPTQVEAMARRGWHTGVI